MYVSIVEVVGKLLKESAEKEGYFTNQTLCLLVRNTLHSIMKMKEDCWEIITTLFTITCDFLSSLKPKEYFLMIAISQIVIPLLRPLLTSSLCLFLVLVFNYLRTSPTNKW